MFLRKINAVLSLLATVLLLDHAIFNAVWMLSRCSIPKTVNNLSWVLLVLMVAHAVISIILGVLGHKGAKKVKTNDYKNLNVPTTVQRISGILIILLMGVHIAGAFNHFQPKILHAILHPLFFILVLAHLAVSTSKSLITLGVGNAKAIKIIDIIVKVLCVITVIASLVGFYMCLFMGVAR
jgi:hypothetical protein